MQGCDGWLFGMHGCIDGKEVTGAARIGNCRIMRGTSYKAHLMIANLFIVNWFPPFSFAAAPGHNGVTSSHHVARGGVFLVAVFAILACLAGVGSVFAESMRPTVKHFHTRGEARVGWFWTCGARWSGSGSNIG